MIPTGFTREEIEEMLSIVSEEPQTVDGGGEWGPSESTDGWYTRLLRAILSDATVKPVAEVVEYTGVMSKIFGDRDIKMLVPFDDLPIGARLFVTSTGDA